MAQQKYSFGGYTPIRQPDEEPEFSLATTSTADSGRNQLGGMSNNAMFTVESYRITITRMEKTDAKNLLQAIVGKNSIPFHYYSPYYGEWRTAPFYVANSSLKVKTVAEGKEMMSGISFQITGINPL